MDLSYDRQVQLAAALAAIYGTEAEGSSVSIGSYGGLHLAVTFKGGQRVRGELVLERHEPGQVGERSEVRGQKPDRRRRRSRR